MKKTKISQRTNEIAGSPWAAEIPLAAIQRETRKGLNALRREYGARRVNAVLAKLSQSMREEMGLN